MLDPSTSPRPTVRTAPGDLIGRRIGGRYRLVSLIAAGGMAQVWQAEDEVLARPVAVKLLHPNLAADRAFVARFRAEAVAAARLSHPSIVAIYDTCADDGLEAIVMELVRGMTLRALLDHRRRLDPRDAITVAVEVAEALAMAHRHGLVHRDVKPANVLLSEDGRVLVADFGIAKASEDPDATRELNLVGTVKYLAPEQVDGDAVDFRADLYALGIVLYEMLCARPPFVAETDAATALARLHADPVPASTHCDDVPPALDATIRRATATRVEDRFPTAEAFRDALLEAERELLGDDLPAPAAAVPTELGPARRVDDEEQAPKAGDLEDGGPPVTVVPRPGSRRSTRTPRTLVPGAVPILLAAVILVALALVALLVFDTDDEESARPSASSQPGPTTGAAGPAPLRTAAAAAFDPFGDNGSENDERAGAAIDDDPASAWETEVYANPEITRVKEGVGLTVRLERPGAIGELVVVSASQGWAASIYADQSSPGSDLASWGEPVVQRSGIAAGTTRFDLDGREAAALLIWITRTDEDGRVAISDVSVTE